MDLHHKSERSCSRHSSRRVCFLVKKKIQLKNLDIYPVAPNDRTIETSSIRLHDPRPLTLHNFYVPPVRGADLRDQLFDHNFLPVDPNAIVMRDFIAHHGTWESNDNEDEIGHRSDYWVLSGDYLPLNDGSNISISPRGIGTAPFTTPT